MKTKILNRERETSEQKIINKRGKTDGSTNSDVLINMKDERKDYERYRLLKPGFRSNSEITDKRQSIVESIFGELKVDENIYYLKSIPHLMNQMNINQEEIKTKSLNTVENCRDTRKCMYQGIEIVYSHH